MSEQPKANTLTVEGEIRSWGLADEESSRRRWIVVTLPFGVVREFFQAQKFSAMTGRGEQRDVIKAHVNRLAREMENGHFTPTPFAAATRKRHRESFQTTERHGKPWVSFEIDHKNPLALTDGLQRTTAMSAVAEKFPAVLNSMVDVVVYLDGNSQEDFINLQAGRGVDTSQIVMMQTISGYGLKKEEQPIYKLALEIAKSLNTMEGSPFHKQIRFSLSREASGLPIKTLLAKGGADSSTSLIGTARMLANMNVPVEKKELANWAAQQMTFAYQALETTADLLAMGKVLTPPPDGSKGAATMLIGVGTMLVYRLLALGRDKPNEQDLKRLVEAANNELDETVSGSFPATRKRMLMGSFTAEYLEDLPGEFHHAIPRELIDLLAPSAFNTPKPEKDEEEEEKPRKGRRKKAAVAEEAEESDE